MRYQEWGEALGEISRAGKTLGMGKEERVGEGEGVKDEGKCMGCGSVPKPTLIRKTRGLGLRVQRAVHELSRSPQFDGQGDTQGFLSLGSFRPAWPPLSPFLVLTESTCPCRGHIYGVQIGQEPL